MNKLSKMTKFGYGLGDLASNLLFQLTVIYLLFFYTDVLGISAMAAGLIFLIARVWDAFNDPVMGLVVDHTRSKHGKARVYLLYGSLPLGIMTVLMFMVPNFGSTGKLIYAMVTYVLWGMLYTLVNIPYSSLTSTLTDNPQERTSLSSIRMIFMLIGVIIVSIVTEPLISIFDEAKTGYMVVAIVFSILAFIFFQLCFSSTSVAKKHQHETENSYKMKEILPILFSNDQLLIVTITSLLGSMAVFIRETAAIYYVTYNLGNGDLLPLFLGVVVISMVVGNLVIPMATKRFDKKGTYLIGSVIALIGSLVFGFVPYDNLPLVLLFAAISSFGIAALSTLGWSMVPDTVEYGEWKTGVRTEGIVYAVFSFSQKLATALAGLFVAYILEVTKYIPGGTEQSSETLNGILSTITIIPIVFILLSLVSVAFYKLDSKTFNNIKSELSKRKKRA